MHTLRYALDSLPTTLDETYLRILDQIEDIDRTQVYGILQFLCFSLRPIQCKETTAIWKVGNKIGPPFNPDNDLFDPEEIFDICSGLVSHGIWSAEKYDRALSRLEARMLVFEGVSPYHIISLSHFSVKEFLLSSRAVLWRVREEPSHMAIIRTTTAYYVYAASMVHNDTYTYPRRSAAVATLRALMATHPLAEYAAHHTGEHLHFLQPREHPSLTDTFQLLLHPNNHLSHPLAALYFHNVVEIAAAHVIGTPPDTPLAIVGLMLAVQLRLTGASEWIFRTFGNEIRESWRVNCHHCHSPLATASMYGYDDIVKVLLDNGVDATRKEEGRLEGTPLEFASADGHVEIVRLLLQAGADAQIRPESKMAGKLLVTAAQEGRIDIVKLLLEYGCDVNARQYGISPPDSTILSPSFYHFDDEYRNYGYAYAIIAASVAGHKDMISLLLDHGADLEIADPMTGHRAIHEVDSEEILRFLVVEKGADVNAVIPHGDFGTRLQRAVYNGAEREVKVLLDVGADVDLGAGKFKNALDAAKAGQGLSRPLVKNQGTVELLLEARERPGMRS
jgi:hypothetical protein